MAKKLGVVIGLLVLVGVIVLAAISFTRPLNQEEAYGASPYGAFASDLISHFPPEYQSAGAVKAVLGQVLRQMQEAAAQRSDPVPCAHVFMYADLPAALSGIPINAEWQLRNAVATLRRLLNAVSGENCLGGYTTFRRAANQVAKLVASV